MSGPTLPMYLHDVDMKNNKLSLLDAGDRLGH